MSKTKWTKKARNRLLPILMALAIIFGTATVATLTSATPAHADDGGYPYSGMACVWSPYATTGPANTNWCDKVDANGNIISDYDWGTIHNDNSNASELSAYGYDYRNCVDYVAWKVASLGVQAAQYKGLGNANQWPANAPGNSLTVDANPAVGAAAVDMSGTYGHVAFISTVNSDGTITVEEYNHGRDGNYGTRTGTLSALGFSKVVHFEKYETSSPGSGSGGGTPPPPPSRQLVINNTAGWAEDGIANAWTQETAANDVQAVAVGGGRMMIINGCGAVFATDVIEQENGWVQETGCNDAKAIAVSANGTQMYLDYCNAVNAQTGSPSMNWTPETGCGTAQAIAIGSDGIQMLLDGCNAVWAKVGVGVGGWNSESGCGTAKAIAAGSDKSQVILNACNAVYAQDGITSTGWNLEQNCGAAQAIAAAGKYQMLINACGEVFAASSITAYWTPETDCNAATAIAVGNQGRQLYIGGNGHTYAEESGTLGNFWTDETPGGGTTAIAVG